MATETLGETWWSQKLYGSPMGEFVILRSRSGSGVIPPPTIGITIYLGEPEGIVIRELQRGRTQHDIAVELGVTQQTVSRWARYESSVDLDEKGWRALAQMGWRLAAAGVLEAQR